MTAAAPPTTVAGRVRGRVAARIARPLTRLDDALPHVALTFDDGPDPDWTGRVLDVLAEHDARATFFCVGSRAARHPELLRRMVAEGHEVGSHSWAHEFLLDLDATDLAHAVLAGHDAVEAAAGRATSLFRPPRGHLDVRTARLARRRGLQTWMWSVETGDWRAGATAEQVLAVCAATRAGDVLLMHDALSGTDAPEGAQVRASTLAALPRLLELLRDRRLGTVPLPQPGSGTVRVPPDGAAGTLPRV